MWRFLRNNGLSITFFGLFAIFLVGQTIAGEVSYNQERKHHGDPPLDYLAYLASGHNMEAIFENWESEFLQMASSVVLTIFLFQKGAAGSRKPPHLRTEQDHADESPFDSDPNWPIHRDSWGQFLYNHSLGLACFAVFALSFLLHAIGGRLLYNVEQAEHGLRPVSLIEFLGTSDFWFQSFQNYQSEYLALGAMAVMTIYLRQKGSPESKALGASMAATGG